jgi:Kef-type K+ transport system membrane component KefB/predicted amino acid-binding ACT domain protein
LNVEGVLVDILVVLIAAKVAAEVAERVRVPAVVGEILAGLLIGPSALGLVGENEVLRVLAELGVILLLLEVGLQMDLAELGAVGRASTLVATVGVAVPFALGFAVASAFGYTGNTAIFVGAALTATSVGITARVFGDLRALTSAEARTVLGAAVADDVMGLVILTVVVRLVTEGSVSIVTVLAIVGIAVGFLMAGGLLGVRLTPRLFQLVHRVSRSAGTMVALALAFALGFAELATIAKLAPVVGAFVAGLSLARSTHAERIRRELTPVGHLFIPVFFLQIGIDADVSAFARPNVLGLAAALFAVATVGKIVASAGAVGSPGDRLLIGLGMLPRGEVGLIFAAIGLREGIVGETLYAALLLVVLATTLVTPPLLRWRLQHIRRARRLATSGSTRTPEGGWLRARDGIVDLAGEPPPHLALHIALQAALLAANARPGPRLLDWLSTHADEPLHWDKVATRELFEVLRRGDVRSWRFLEASGLLERALPELADALRHRRADAFELDPTHALRWALVDRLGHLGADPIFASEHTCLVHPEWLLLAALILDIAGEDGSSIEATRRLVQRLDLGAEAEQEIVLLVADNALLRAAARRADGLDETSVLQLAAHLERPERARALYLLSLALGDLEPHERRRVDDLYTIVQAALEHTELTGLDARNVAERHRAEATRLAGGDAAVAERIERAPRGYVLAQTSDDIARHATLLEPLPARGKARVAVLPSGTEWRVDVACRDQPGLLAAVTGMLFEARLDVVDAVIATWGDGGAVESFVVGSKLQPDAPALQLAIEGALGRPVLSPPVEDIELHFDDDGSPWYTLCEVTGADRPGLLHRLAVAFAAAGAEVHSAHISTAVGHVIDRFDLTDRRGAKLTEPIKDKIRAALSAGVVPRRSWISRGANKVGTLPKHTGDRAETRLP